MSFTNFESLFNSFKTLRVAVLGDVMLDTYWWGKADRISPEAPVPVVAIQEKEYRIGGAGNVALNLSSLGADVTLLSVLGSDDTGNTLKQLLKNYNIDISFLQEDANRVTTNKTRILSRNQQMMRLDEETSLPISYAQEQQLLDAFKKMIETNKPELLIFEDYNKGVLTENVIQEVINLCKTNNILTAVDPKKHNFFSYTHIDLFKPNLKEVKDALHLPEQALSMAYLQDIHQQLHQQLQHHISLITLSEKGMFYQDAASHGWIPTQVRRVADVSGAGDTVIAVAALVYAATRNIQLMVNIANLAAGLVCEEVGTAVINPERLLRECTERLT